MTRDYEPIRSSDTPAPNRARTLAIIVAIALICGIVAGGWLVTRFSQGEADGAQIAAQGTAASEQAATALGQRIGPDGTVAAEAPVGDDQPAAMASAPLTPETNRALATRVADLEDRLSRINVAAQAASGNAARAEGLLVAFAARRIIDKGVPLGYIEGQLRLRFGDQQPRAVETIIETGNKPVTLEDLRTGLADISGELVSGSDVGGLWSNFRRELGELFVIREEGTPSPVPTRRLERAQRSLDAGNVDAAIAEVEAMPGRDAAEEWLIEARRYARVREALDLIETAAILEPLRSGETSPGAVAPVTPSTTR
jgi:hypothetical protein